MPARVNGLSPPREASAVTDLPNWGAGVKVRSRLLLASSLATALVFSAGFGAWAAYAPLSGAIITTGFVAAAGQNQRIQHLDGGVVTDVLAREGDRVKAGDILLRVDETAARSQRDALGKRAILHSVRALRLTAERDGAESLSFPADLQDQARHWGMADLLAEQDKEFAIRLESYRQEQTILKQRTEALKNQIDGLLAQQGAVERQLTLVQEEASRKKELLQKGLTNRSEYAELLQSEAALLGQLGQIKSGVLASRTQIVETQAQLARHVAGRVETAATELGQVRGELAVIGEQLRAAEAVLSRTTVRAPSDGIVLRSNVNVAGSVLRPGEVVLELLPTHDDLLVEARVAPSDVDAVRVGQTATLRFSALNARVTPAVAADVIYMSADRLVDGATGETFYVARLRIDGDLPADLPEEKIYPGLPVEAYIATGERTFLDYLAKPLTDRFARAFRED